MPQPLQEGEFAGFFFHLAEQVADGLGLLIVLQEVGQQAVTETGTEHREDLGRKGAALLLPQTQALFASLKNTSMDQRPTYFCTTWMAVRVRSGVKKAVQEGSALILRPGRASGSGALSPLVKTMPL